MERLGLAPEEVLVVDDLPLGLEMARGAGTDFAAAGWAHHIPELRAYMADHGAAVFPSPAALYDYLFSGSAHRDAT